MKRIGVILVILGLILVIGINGENWIRANYGKIDLAKVLVLPTPAIRTISIKVKRVVDGDTVELEDGTKVRYIGMDTPETKDPRKPVQCYGQEAAERNRQLVEGKEVRLESDTADKDVYGRLLRYVWVGETMINQQLVAEGFARIDTVPPDVKYQPVFLKLEQEARSKNLGLWNKNVCQYD